MMLRFKKTVLALLLITVLLVLTSCGGPEATYKSANNLLAKGKYAEAAEKFASLGSYEDATYLTIYADACAKGESTDLNTVMEAISTFYDLSGFKDSDMRAAYYWGRFYEMAASRFEKDNMAGDNIVALENALEYYKTIPLFLDCPARIKALEKDIPAAKDKAYNTAVKEAESGNYFEADEIFGTLGDYKDSEKRIAYYDIREAEDALVNTADHTALGSVAIDYILLGDYLDCAQRAKNLQERKTAIISDKYIQAEKYITEGKAEAAFSILSDAASYSRGNEHYRSIWYSVAEALYKKNSKLHALIAFQTCGNYKNSMAYQRDLLSSFSGKIDTSFRHSVGVNSNGTVTVAGYDDCVSEYIVRDWTDVDSVAVGSFWIAGLKADGSVIAATKIQAAARQSEVEDINSWANIVSLATGNECIVGLRADGTVLAEGSVYSGMRDYATWTDIVSIDAGAQHIVGLKSDGAVVVAGTNEYGQCNVSEWTDIVAIAAGNYHTIGLKADGTVIATGSNESGECNVHSWNSIVAISAGGFNTVGLKADGTVVATGNNDDGQCDVNHWTDIVAISSTRRHTVAVKTDGTVVAAGSDFSGQCSVDFWDLW